MDLRQLRYFAKVVESGSFSKAASQLHVAQPALSKQVQQFEEDLGLALIERGSRPVRLTEPGRVIYEQALQILERVDDLREMYSNDLRFIEQF